MSRKSVAWWLNDQSYGGIISERMLATVPVGHGYLCGLEIVFIDAGAPRLFLMRRTTPADLLRMGYRIIDAAHARALHEAVPAWVESWES